MRPGQSAKHRLARGAVPSPRRACGSLHVQNSAGDKRLEAVSILVKISAKRWRLNAAEVPGGFKA